MNPREQRITIFRESVRILLLRRQDPHDAELADAAGVDGGLPRKETWLWHKIVEAAERDLLPSRAPHLNHDEGLVDSSTEAWTMSPPRTSNLNPEEWFQASFDFLASAEDQGDPGTSGDSVLQAPTS
ncbi:MAG TPA: hypothetical protein VND64_10495 [Pirellulales bacterium]|nr:hypothetical protein [Pirellulales bacterium]